MNGVATLFLPYIRAGRSSLGISINSSLVSLTEEAYKMISTMTRIILAVIAVTVFLCTFESAEANYKNAPMNGIMFGKRGPTEYDSRSKAFTALCEIATEACQTWFPSQENK